VTAEVVPAQRAPAPQLGCFDPRDALGELAGAKDTQVDDSAHDEAKR
jgi:hypothetical protein